MRKSLFIGVLLLVASGLFAQENKERKPAFSMGVEAAQPVGTETKGYGLSYGGSLQEEFILGKAGITLNAGYLHHTTRRYVSDAVKHQAWLMGGGRYYFIKKVYAFGQLGASVFTGSDYGGATFVYAAGVGAKLSVVDVSLRYLSAPVNIEFATVGLRVAIIL